MSDLRLEIPESRLAPLRWVADIVFGEMLGVPVRAVASNEADIVLSADGRSLTTTSLFPDLDRPRADWREQMPEVPLAEWDVAALHSGAKEGMRLPVLFGHPELEIQPQSVRCGVDILGSIFFMLSRFEEIVLPDRDRHDRFPAKASTAGKAGFLTRPVVDEHVEVLWALMQRLWPTLQRRRRHGRIMPSCDVDQPFDRVGNNPAALMRSLGGDLFKRRDARLAWRRCRNFIGQRNGDLRFDPYFTFDRYMDVCERDGHRAAFYFIADRSAGQIDGDYDIGEPRVLDLLRRIDRRGHEIGMHGSYNSFRDADRIRSERQRLVEACRKAGLDVAISGNRQHYLRWDAAQTPDHLAEAGFEYDSSGTFADHPGFRFGTAFSFPMWSWRELRPLALRQKPLVVMEVSVMSSSYLGLGLTDAALDLMLDLKRKSLCHGGDFTLLWHNSHLLAERDWAVFNALLANGNATPNDIEPR